MITFNTKQLLSILESHKGTVEVRTTNPVYKLIHIKAVDGLATFKSTNIDSVFINTIKLNTEASDIEMCIDFYVLLKIVSKVKYDTISLTLKDDTIIISSNKLKYSMTASSVKEFLNLDFISLENEEVNTLSYNNIELFNDFKNVVFASSKEETHYYLNTIAIDLENKQLICTDAHRLSNTKLRSNDVVLNKGIDSLVMLPRKSANNLLTHFKKMYNLNLKSTKNHIKDTINIRMNNEYIEFSYNNSIYITKLVDGNFPQYEAVIPKEVGMEVIFNKSKLIEVINNISIISTDNIKAIRFELLPDSCKIISNYSDRGSAEEEINVKWNYDNFIFGCNVEYLLDILKYLPEEEIRFGFINESSPVLITSNEYQRMVLMPMKV